LEYRKKTTKIVALSLDIKEYIEERENTLRSRLKWLSKNIAKLERASLVDGDFI